MQAASTERFCMSTDGLLKALNDSQRYLDIVQKQLLSKSETEWLIGTTVNNFVQYYNSGFVEYRKSVTEAGDYAAVEWTGRGARFRDALGREYIDCLAVLACSTWGGRILKSWGPCKRNYRRARCQRRSCLILSVACWLICWRRLRRGTFSIVSL